MKYAFLIISLTLPIILQAQLQEFEVNDMATPEAPVVQANTSHPNNALLLIYSDLEGLQFRSSVGAINQQTYNSTASRYEVLVSPLKQMIFVAKPGYMEVRVGTINPRPKAVLYYSVETKVGINAFNHPVELQIETTPEGCDLWLNGIKTAEKTPFSGKMNPGSTQLRLEKTNYVTLDTIVALRGESYTLSLNLKKSEGQYEIISDPIGAEVSLDGDVLGITPLWGFLPVGNYTIQLEAGNYYPTEKDITISTAEPANINIQLISKDRLNCIDADGNEYKTIEIGDQLWMAENLKTTRFSNGDQIAEVKDNFDWDSDVPARCRYDHKKRMGSKYGELYNWQVVNDDRDICPVGWKIPSDEDWTGLSLHLDPKSRRNPAAARGVGPNDVQSYTAGGYLKKRGGGWQKPNVDAKNKDRFSATPGGYRHYTGEFELIGEITIWWSKTSTKTDEA